MLVPRSLKQAVYSPINKGHFGLASACYTHFTSPIRRYPDLIVHRILKERLHGRYQEAHWKKELAGIAAHASRRERVAVDAEREYLDLQKVRLMESRVGETFTGVISSVTNFGLFVQLNEFFVEGLVHVTTLGNDYYVFDEARMTLRGRRTGRTYAMGQAVHVRLAAANVAKRQLDFKLLFFFFFFFYSPCFSTNFLMSSTWLEHQFRFLQTELKRELVLRRRLNHEHRFSLKLGL